MGYCFGCPLALHFARQAGSVAAFSVAHGAVSLPDDIMELKAPGFFACAEHDMAMSASVRSRLQALIKYASVRLEGG